MATIKRPHDTTQKEIKSNNMKQLFSRTTTLLRTALLLGVLSFVNTCAKQRLAGSARRVVLLLTLLCYAGGAWGQVANISTGAIDNIDKIAEYNELRTSYPVNATRLIPAFSGWTNGTSLTNGGAGDPMRPNQSQHWDGTATSQYYEMAANQWNANSWENSRYTILRLPKGKYVLLGACRSSANTTAYISVSGTKVFTPTGGDRGYGIATDGRPSFNPFDTYANNNNGTGWQYRYIKFEVTADGGADVRIEIGASANTQRQWMSFTQPLLFAESTTYESLNLGTPILTDLTQGMYMEWTGYDANATSTSTTGCAYGFGTSTGSVYGDMNVNGNHYADLSKYSKLVLTVTAGTPRLLFNRQGMDNSGDFIESTGDSGRGYVTHENNSNIWIIDIEAIVRDYGYAHLNCIKGLNGNVTITSATLTAPQATFIPATTINQRVEKTFTFTDGDAFLRDPREFTVQFNFDDWKLYLYDNNNQKVAEQDLSHGNGGGPDGWWYVWDRFYDHTLHFGNGNNPINNFYVRWYLKDKSGNVVNIDNSLINNSIYQQTHSLEDGLVWSSRMGDGITDLHTILRMTIDGTPLGGNPFFLTQYDLVCAISDAGNESYFENDVYVDASPINIEYTFKFEFAQLEFPVTNKEVTHKMSYLYDYAKQYGDFDLEKQGLATDAQSDWWNYDKETQKVNHFEITHYVEFGETVQLSLPTVLNADNDHRLFQRWYNYDNETDLTGLKSHLSLNSSDGNVPYYLYQNGMVTGERLYWGENGALLNGHNPYALRFINFTNSDGKPFTVAADVSRYSDMTYEKPAAPLEGNLEEPSLTMRYIYYMKDAREMAANLTSKPETDWENTDNTNWLESKVFHFPSKPLAYENQKLVGYMGEFIGIRHIFADYWVFDNPSYVAQYNAGTNLDELNNHLVHAVTDRNGGNIQVEIYDPNQTGIRLGGYNPKIDLHGKDIYGKEIWGDIVPQVGDYIRVYYSDKVTDGGDNNFNPRWKHGYDENGIPDWNDFQSSYTDYPDDGYFEAQIPNADVVDELKSTGLRFQGRGFTMLRIEIIRNNVSLRIIRNQQTVFDGWGTIVTISPVYAVGNDNDYQGFYFYDKMPPSWAGDKTSYGDSRFVVFRYPSDGNGGVKEVTNTGKEAYLRVYLRVPNSTQRYQIAQFTIIFDKDSETLPWKSVDGSENDEENGVINFVQGTKRDPNKLQERAGKPIAKITFDYPYPTNEPNKHTYHYPSKGDTRHANNPNPFGPGGTIANSSPIPLTFDKTNYSFDGDDANWAAYAMVGQKSTRWGMQQMCWPSNDSEHGYNIDPDAHFKSAFLYIDASELPGDICSAPFEGDFCAGDHLMVSGWITGCNVAGGSDYRCPGGITLTLKGEHTVNGEKVTETLYRFCPGQVYELDDGTVPGEPGSIDGQYQNIYNVVWQQFYFEFIVQEKFDRHWLEVNNNCVSSTGGDFMLDNIEVYTIVPDVKPKMNTSVCVDKDGNVDMRLLKLEVDFNKMKSTAEKSDNTNQSTEHYFGFVILEKEAFLKKLKEKVPALSAYSLEELAESVENGKVIFDEHATHQEGYVYITKNQYKEAFDAALLRKDGPAYDKKMWTSDPTITNSVRGAGLMYFKWSSVFNNAIQPVYSFADAMNRTSAVYREEDEEGYRSLVFNGNYPDLPWKANTDYYIIPSHAFINITAPRIWEENVYKTFNLCSTECTHASLFRIEPSYELLGLEKSEETNDYMVCEGQIPTIALNLKGYDFNGNEVPMKDINYDWWLGDKANGVLATLDEYHKQKKPAGQGGGGPANDIHLDVALSTLRIYYPDVTDLDGIISHPADPVKGTPELTERMVNYLRELVDAGQLVLHQKSISVPAEPAAADDPYFYLVACPIHDEMYDQALNPQANEYVAFFCDEPQGLRIKLGQKAPRLQTGFVPGEHGFQTYNYNFPANTNPVLSIRLAKAAQFETVKNTEEELVGGAVSQTVNYLWLPIRNAQTESANGVIKMSDDDNIYLAASNDLTWDKKISKEMNKNGLPPVVGRIVRLQAINTKDNSENAQPGATINTEAQDGYNRLAIYFKKDFNVREGYNYTLSLPFQEDEPDSEKRNACNGTILINLKIVPDYEVWTGAAGNIDWNNDENWRRADGNTNTTITNKFDVYSDELYRANGAENNANSPLYKYTTNKDNYYSSSKKATAKPSSDQVLRKGFAPLYCTHVLMKSDEWGNAPELYDGLDAGTAANNTGLNDAPFPNLRETSTPILKFDMQARKRSLWKETYGSDPDRGSDDRPNDLIAEMYQINSCDEIAFQPGTELRNAHLLNYNNAWVEYQLDNKRWYLLGSPLQGTISGEWYAPKTTAQQKTTYYDPVAFRPRYIKVANPKPTDNPYQNGWFTLNGETYSATTDAEVDSSKDYYYLYEPSAYDRYNPAIYQRSWDKAKAVLYEVGSSYNINDDSQTQNLGNASEGMWSSGSWNVEGADAYLDRLGYKPMGGNKANVAIKGMWSNTYNDAQVDYATGGFSVMVMNHLKGTQNDKSGNKSIIRLPKEDTMYDYYEFSQTNANDGGTDTELSLIQTGPKNRALNRGRLKTDKLLPVLLDGGENKMIQRTEKAISRYGDRREYTRIPIKEDTLIAMNNTFASTVGDGGVETQPDAGFFKETVPAGVSNLGFFLVENPFPCGLDMAKFFAANSETFTQEEIENASEGDPAYGKTTNDVKSGLERKYWLLTATGQHLVQRAGKDEWITTDGSPINYLNPNYVEPEPTDPEPTDPEPTEPKTLPFYPHAVVAPGQGFFVQAKSSTGDLTVTFNRDMQAQSRFGMIEGEGKTYTIVVGQSQVMRPMRKLIDTDDDGIPDTENPDETSTEYETIDVDLNGNGIYGELNVTIGEGDEAVTRDEKENVMVPVYETDETTGEKIPKLEDIEQDVVIYKYVPETLLLTPDDETTPGVDESETIEKEYPLLSRRTRSTGPSPMHGLVITAKRGADQSSALVMKRENASDDFLPSEDTETFIIGGELQSPAVPTVYTLCGRLATTINSIHDFTCLPLGVESNSEAPCTLTFQGVEMLGDSVAFYDAVERKLTPLESGMKFTVSGQTQNRYYIVSSLNEEEVAEETHLQIFTEGRTAKVIASTAEPITDVRCFDAAGRLVHSASPQSMEYSFTLPDDGIYIIEAKTEKDRKTKKVAVK